MSEVHRRVDDRPEVAERRSLELPAQLPQRQVAQQLAGKRRRRGEVGGGTASDATGGPFRPDHRGPHPSGAVKVSVGPVDTHAWIAPFSCTCRTPPVEPPGRRPPGLGRREPRAPARRGRLRRALLASRSPARCGARTAASCRRRWASSCSTPTSRKLRMDGCLMTAAGYSVTAHTNLKSSCCYLLPAERLHGTHLRRPDAEPQLEGDRAARRTPSRCGSRCTRSGAACRRAPRTPTTAATGGRCAGRSRSRRRASTCGSRCGAV